MQLPIYITHPIDLTFSSQVKGHTWPAKCHAVVCTARLSYQLYHIWSLLNQTCVSRARKNGAEDDFRVSGECAILVDRLRFDTVRGPLKRRWVVYVPQSLTLKYTTSCSRSFWITVSCFELIGGRNESWPCFLWGTNLIFLCLYFI